MHELFLCTVSYEPIFLGQVPMGLIFYVFTFPQRLLMCIYPYQKKKLLFLLVLLFVYYG